MQLFFIWGMGIPRPHTRIIQRRPEVKTFPKGKMQEEKSLQVMGGL